MNSIDKLIQIFSGFPGVGPRQARRFVYYLLTRQNGALEEFSKNILELKEDVVMCSECGRFFQTKNKSGSICNICSDQNRDQTTLMLVQRDIDLESVERNAKSAQNGGFNGVYFVLGGSVPILEKEPDKKIRIKALQNIVEKRIKEGLKEIIIAVNWNPEGESTGNYVEKILKPLTLKNKIKISHLGKGLSMGAELEYTDPDTLKNALRNRS